MTATYTCPSATGVHTQRSARKPPHVHVWLHTYVYLYFTCTSVVCVYNSSRIHRLYLCLFASTCVRRVCRHLPRHRRASGHPTLVPSLLPPPHPKPVCGRRPRALQKEREEETADPSEATRDEVLSLSLSLSVYSLCLATACLIEGI